MPVDLIRKSFNDAGKFLYKVAKPYTNIIRQRMDEYYKEATLLAQSFSIAVPSDAATAFIQKLNQLILETTTAYNQRSSKKKAEDDSPGDRII